MLMRGWCGDTRWRLVADSYFCIVSEGWESWPACLSYRLRLGVVSGITMKMVDYMFCSLIRPHAVNITGRYIW